MSELTPITRIESYLDAIVNSGIPPTEDITRIETFLQAIYDNQVCALTPITRIEMFLGKISGQNIVLPEPITRIELYLAAIAGEDVELPENPITRLEMYLAEWADSGDWTTISGAIVEFITQRAHKLKSCVVSLEPQQDLHGYDSPWPAGGGVNKFNEDTELGAIGSNGVPYATNDSIRSASFSPCLPSTAYYICGTVAIYFYDSTETFIEVQYANNNVKTSPANAAYFKLGFYAAYGTTYKYDIAVNDPSTVTTYSPYSNICPISGWTGVSVWDTGHNVWDEQTELGLLNPDGSVTTTTSRLVSSLISVVPGASYAFCWPSSSGIGRAAFYDENKNFVKYEPDFPPSTSVPDVSVFTVPNGACYLRFNLIAAYWTTYHHDVSINYPSTDTEYHAYNGNSYSVTFGETVYGGKVDVVSGEMPVTYAEYIFTGNEYWNASATPNRFFCYVNDYLPYPMAEQPMVADAKQNVISSIFGESVYKNADGVAYIVNASYRRQYVVNTTAASTTAEIAALMAGTQLVYEIETPIQTTITPTPITALKGYNAMWSDGGDIEVTVHGTPVEVSTPQALNMLLGGAYRNGGTSDDVSDDEALDIILGGEQR